MNTTNTVPTDSQQKITVESQLIYALWLQGRAYAGFEAEFEVKTILVGNGAKVKVTCKTEKGKKLDKVEGAIVLNRYRGKVVIPDTVKPDDYVYLEVELPKHGLSGESNSIPVRPPIEVSSMKWSKQEVERDEEVTLTCVFTNGVEDGDKASVIIYEYDNDGYHDKVVTIPTVIKDSKVELAWKFIYQEDTDDIPTDEQLKKYGKSYNPPEYFFVVMVDNVPVGRKQESGLLEFKDFVDITVIESGKPLANEKVKVVFADGSEKEVTTDDKGKIVLQKVPPGAVDLDLINDAKLRDEEEKLLEEYSDDQEDDSGGESDFQADTSCDEGDFGPDPEYKSGGTTGTDFYENPGDETDSDADDE
jgi:hypothetical protein